MKVFLTGGAGFIGSLLTERLLEHGFKVKVFDSFEFGAKPLVYFFDHPNFELIKGDIRNEKDLSSMRDCDIVVHLAAMVFTGGKKLRKQVMNVNYEATKKIVDLCKKYSISRFIFPSSCSCYGVTNEICTEETPVSATNVYAESKIKSEQYILQQEDNYFSPTILRLSTLFGMSPRMRFDLLVNDLTVQACINRELKVFNPDAWRPLLSVDDAVDVFLMFCKRWWKDNITGVYNVGHENLNYKKRQICSLLKNEIPHLKIEYQKASSEDVRNYRVSFKKIQKQLSFVPSKTLETEISKLVKAINEGVFPMPFSSFYNNLKHYEEVSNANRR